MYYGTLDYEKLYTHQTKPITEVKRITVLWDFTIQTDRKIKNNWPDVLVKDYEKKNSI